MEPSEPLTVQDVLDALARMLASNPEVATRPVHILNMEDDETDEDEPWEGLVTHVESDCFAEEQGMVVSLLAWRSMNSVRPG